MIRKYFITIIFLLFFANHAHATTDSTGEQPKSVEVVLGLVNQYCGACHKVPPPSIMPKQYWPRSVQAMADLAAEQMGREFIPAEIIRDITAYYYGSSPESLPLLPYFRNTARSPLFETSEAGRRSPTPLVINLNAVALTGGHEPEFLICDGEHNEVSLLTRSADTWRETVLASVQMPSHTEVVDYDLDGDNDIIVAALGHLPPSDKLAGKILLLRQSASGAFEKELLLEGVGRITDARPVDIDADGDLDLVIAVFGGGNVGELAWLENTGTGKPVKHAIINASGALNVSLVDLNADGRMDIVSLIAQEYEMVLALINKGAGQFEQVPLGSAPHPMFGFTGMNLVDLDGDSDMDILLTNGDAHDLHMDPKPYHGVQWFENMGDLNFKFHDIGRFYGAVTALAGDLDADGDLDIVAASWNNYWQDDRRQSLIWFENDGKQNFERHNITNRPQSIVSLELMDVTGDDRPDIIAGIFRIDLLMRKFAASETRDEEKNNPGPERESPLERIIVLQMVDRDEGADNAAQ